MRRAWIFAGIIALLPGSSVATDAIADGLDADERELVGWAEGQFERIGFELPDVEVRFHEGQEPCRGQEGRFRGATTRRRIDICVPDRGSAASDLHRRRTLVHEFAHAWDHAHLDDGDRTELAVLLGTDGWYDTEPAWGEQGAERFAETILWGLYDQRRRPLLVDVACRDVADDFRAITGREPLGPVAANCVRRDTDGQR